MNLCELRAYAGKRICVALSGGVDSVVLLHNLLHQPREWNLSVSALTCEHGIRGKQSVRDLEFVQSLCEKWEVPLTVFRADIPARARDSKCGLEEEGRKFRYECFASVIESGKADFVATAHHRDDLAETVLFRLARGTSLSGINAIRERDGILRPFLSVSRAEIEQYAREHKLAYRKDKSNRDERYRRNKLRHTVMPALERVVGGAGAHLAQFACKAEEDDACLQSLALQHISESKGEVAFPVNLPMPLFARACTIAFRKLNLESYTAKNIEEIASLKTLQSGRKASLPCGLETIREGERIIVYRTCLEGIAEVPFVMGTIPFGERTVTVSTEKTDGALFADLDAFPADCIVRTRREGDVFVPFHGSRKSLKEYLTDKKISAREGRKLPLIASGNEILVICGVEISDKVKVTDETTRRVFITVP